MHRRLRVKLPLYLFLCFFGGQLAFQLSGQEASKTPNVIFILADDLGYGDLGCYGQKTLKTPRIDSLAEEGLRFKSFYSGNTVCRPSRLSLWTGLDPRHTAIFGNQHYALPETTPTIASELKSAGYSTAIIGKWSLLHEDVGHPLDRNFDRFFGYNDQSLAHNHFPPQLWSDRDPYPLEGNILATGNPDYRGRVSSTKVTWSHTKLTEEALKFIEQGSKRSSPFLLHLHWIVPHANNEAGETLGDGMEVPDYGSYADEDWPAPEKGFASMIEKMDTDVGRIVDLVDALGIAENTLIIFTSDNGPHNEGTHDYEFFDSNGPLRGLKRDLYEGGIRVPFIARWPGTTPANRTTDLPAAFWDILPTFCELAKTEPPAQVDGVSLVPTLTGEPQTIDRALHWRFAEFNFSRLAVRQGNWKAVKHSDQRAWELYDLQNDLGEQNDLADEMPHFLEKLTADMQ